MSARMSLFFVFVMLLFPNTSFSTDVLPLDTALQNTYRACVDIDQDFHHMKVLAGINTAVTGVGTGLGVGAVATGIAKSNTDKKIADIEKLLEEIKQNTRTLSTGTLTFEDMQTLSAEFENSHDLAVGSIQDYQQKKQELTKKSKKLGDWRTGLLVGNTATNIAGVIIANKIRTDSGLQPKVDACVASLNELNNSILASKVAGENVTEAKLIYDTCNKYKHLDLSPIDNRAKGAMVSSAVGVVASGIGSVTSGLANSDNIRNDDSTSGKNKEKNLNTASNVLAVGGTLASTTATIFNASQIATINKASAISEECTRVLK